MLCTDPSPPVVHVPPFLRALCAQALLRIKGQSGGGVGKKVEEKVRALVLVKASYPSNVVPVSPCGFR